LRIGINTALVYVGDLGNARKLDLTVIGQGVNFAKRLESAAESDCIMIGKATRESLLRPPPFGTQLVQRLIQIKNVPDLIEAYECDPMQDDFELKKQSASAYRAFVDRNRKEVRSPVPAANILVVGRWGRGHLISFSPSGLGFQSDCYFGRGVNIVVELDTADGLLGARLRALRLLPLLCEVRWGSKIDGMARAYRLGVMIKNLDSGMRGALFEEIRAAAGQSDLPAKQVA
jgi:hypothetical protein